jgi:hypothetical protein
MREQSMFSWQWENFSEIIRTHAPMIEDHGPLAGPVYRFTLERDADLHLRMDTEAPVSAMEPQPPERTRTVGINDDRIRFRSSTGLELEAIGVTARRTSRRYEGIAPGITTQEVEIHHLIGKFAQTEKPRYTIDCWRMFPLPFSGPITSKRRAQTPLP